MPSVLRLNRFDRAEREGLLDAATYRANIEDGTVISTSVENI